MNAALFQKIDALLDPLTPAQIARIGSAFRKAHCPQKQATRLLADWVRIAETAHQHALKTALHRENVLMRPAVRKRRDRRLRQATAALDRAITAVLEAVSLLEKHLLFSYEDLHRSMGGVEMFLVRVRAQVDSYSQQMSALRPLGNRSGDTLRWVPERCLGEVLAAYFRHKNWPISTKRTDLFSAIVTTALGRQAVNDQTLRRLKASSLDYPTLEAAAPPVESLAEPQRAAEGRKTKRQHTASAVT